MRFFNPIKPSTWSADKRGGQSAFVSRSNNNEGRKSVANKRSSRTASTKQTSQSKKKKTATARKPTRKSGTVKILEKTGSSFASAYRDGVNSVRTNFSQGYTFKSILKKTSCSHPLDDVDDLEDNNVTSRYLHRISCVRFNDDITIHEEDPERPYGITYTSTDEASLDDISTTSTNSSSSGEVSEEWGLLRQFEDTLLDSLFLCQSSKEMASEENMFAEERGERSSAYFSRDMYNRVPRNMIVDTLRMCKSDNIDDLDSLNDEPVASKRRYHQKTTRSTLFDGLYLCKPSSVHVSDDNYIVVENHTSKVTITHQQKERKDKLMQFREVLAKARLRYVQEYRKAKQSNLSDLVSCNSPKYHPTTRDTNGDKVQARQTETIEFVTSPQPSIVSIPDDEDMIDSGLIRTGAFDTMNVGMSKTRSDSVTGLLRNRQSALSQSRPASFGMNIHEHAHRFHPPPRPPCNSPIVVPLAMKSYDNHIEQNCAAESEVNPEINTNAFPTRQSMATPEPDLIHNRAYEF